MTPLANFCAPPAGCSMDDRLLAALCAGRLGVA
jgi:hypothetical protein